MFVNNIEPVLFMIGPLEIRYYGIIYALGFIISIYFMRYFVKKGLIKLTNEQINDLFFWLIIGVVVGARFFEVFIWYPGYYFSNPQKILALWEGGLSFHGAILGALVVIYWFAKKHRIRLLKLLDLLVIPAALASALGRLGNFLNSELYGPVTDVSWCVVFERIDDQCRHPYQLYSFLKRIIMFAGALYLSTKKLKEGLLFWLFVFFMGLGRFILDFYRVDTLFFGFSTGQWLSLIMVVVSAVVLAKRYVRWK